MTNELRKTKIAFIEVYLGASAKIETVIEIHVC